MKKITLAALTVLSGIVFSCSSDDGADTSGTLTGKWYNKEYKVGGETFPYDDHEECGKDYVEFLTATTGRSVDVWNCDEYADNFTYVRNGNTVTVNSGGQTVVATILELSSTTLKIRNSYDFDDDGDDEQVIEVLTRN